jgi:DNA polymerase-3 subunit delta'
MLFSEIIGQEEIKQRLLSGIQRQRIPHAQLFLGPEGSGKLALALAYAQNINCTNKQNGEACGNCSNCHKYQTLAHPDLHFIFPTATVKGISKPISDDFITEWREFLIDNKAYIKLSDWNKKIEIEKKQSSINTRDCNQIIKKLSYESYESEYKVMIIWMIEKLHHAAAPKILKILEEPSPKTLFILISENPSSILKTILSRTQLVKIPAIKEDALRHFLLAKKYDVSLIRDVLPLANGNQIRAIELLKNTEETTYTYQHFVQWMRVCYSFKMEDMLSFTSEMAKNSRGKNVNFLTYSLRMIRESLLMSYKMDEQIQLTKEEETFMAKFSRFVHPGNIPAINEEINKAIFHIERNGHINILFTDLSIKIGQLLRIK